MKRMHSMCPSPAPAIQTVSPSRDASSAVDIVTVLGPGMSKDMRGYFNRLYQQFGHVGHIVGDSSSAITEDLFSDLHKSGKLGKNTRVFFFMHGTASDRHFVRADQTGQSPLPTLDLIRLVRTGSKHRGAKIVWNGDIHLISCRAGQVRHDLKSDEDLWSSGQCFIYGGRKNIISMADSNDTITEVLRYLATNRDRQPSAMDLLAFVSSFTGSCTSLIGGNLKEELVVHAPQTFDPMSQHWLQGEILRHRTESALPFEKARVRGQHAVLMQLGSAVAELPVQTKDQHSKRAVKILVNRIMAGDNSGVADLIAEDRGVVHSDTLGTTPLLLAVKRGNESIVRLLIDAGADVNFCAQGHRSPLVIATKRGDLRLIELLLDNGANVDGGPTCSASSLLVACKGQQVEAAKFLLKYQPDVNCRDDRDATALMYASEMGDGELICALLAERADIDACDLDGDSALTYATRSLHYDAMNILLLNGANPDIGLPLMMAASSDDAAAVARLAAAGATIDISNDGLTPLQEAVGSGGSKTVRVLIEAGADTSVLDERGQTILTLACQNKDAPMARTIIRHARHLIETPNRDGLTPLMVAAAVGDDDLVGLLANQANLDRKTPTGKTALLLACERGRSDVARQLIHAGADSNLCDNLGLSPLEAAKRLGDHDLAFILMERGAMLSQ